MSQEEVVEIPNSPHAKYWVIPFKYNYSKDASKCPSCYGLGIPWNGWFSCEDCECIALVAEGTAFLPIGHQPPDIIREDVWEEL